MPQDNQRNDPGQPSTTKQEGAGRQGQGGQQQRTPQQTGQQRHQQKGQQDPSRPPTEPQMDEQEDEDEGIGRGQD